MLFLVLIATNKIKNFFTIMAMSYKENACNFASLHKHILKNGKIRKKKLQQFLSDFSLTDPHVQTNFISAHQWLNWSFSSKCQINSQNSWSFHSKCGSVTQAWQGGEGGSNFVNICVTYYVGRPLKVVGEIRKLQKLMQSINN